MLEFITDTCKAIVHVLQASLAESTEERLRQEFGATGKVGQDLRIEASHHRIEAAILRGEIKPVNKEYID